MLKEKLSCCLTDYVAKQVHNGNYLINDEDLNNKVKLLFLYSYMLDSYDCEDIVPTKVKQSIVNLCNYNTCNNCENIKIVVEDWTPDVSNYATKWIAANVECIARKTKWVSNSHECYTDIIVIPEPTLPVRQSKWIVASRCCEQATKWIPSVNCCAQQENINCKNCTNC
jgi:hypothetical protein